MSSHPELDDPLYHICSSLEFQFLNTIVNGESAIKDFAELLTEVQGFAAGNLLACPSHSKTTIAYRAASSISIISSSFMAMEDRSKEIENDLFADITDVLQHLSMQDSSPSSDIKPLKHLEAARSPRSVDDDGSGIFMQTSAPLLWLLKHLDNPYPSLATKISLCKQSGLSLKAITEWFSHTRRRIGWTSISKRHFNGDRQMTRDCVHRVLFEQSESLCYPKNIVESVENMKMVAERLHAKKSQRTIHASRHITPVGRHERVEMSSATRPLKLSPTYPTCLQQDDATFNHRTVSDGLRSNDQCFMSVRRKRSRDSCSADILDGEAVECSRPVKKLKTPQLSHSRTVTRTASLSTISSRETTAELQTPTLSIASLPVESPFASINNWISSVVDETPNPLHEDYIENGRSQKRRLSNSELSEPCKRFQSEDTFVPCPKVASDSKSSSTSVSGIDVFNILSQVDFEIPPPVSLLDNIYPGESLELEAFAYSNELLPLCAKQDSQDAGHSSSRSTILLNEVNFPDYVTCERNATDNDPCYSLLASDFSNILHSSDPDKDISDLEKLERINELLSEAAKLQQEVFG